jgi:CHAT domain-containing protein/Tfp pilus assembly protein PilF
MSLGGALKRWEASSVLGFHQRPIKEAWHAGSVRPQAISRGEVIIQEMGDHQASYHWQRQVVNQNPANFLALFLLFSLSAVAPHQAFGRHPGLHQQPAQSSSGTGDKQDVRSLEAGQLIRRELAEGQQHSYRIGLSADQFLKAAVEQAGIDVVVQMSGPGGAEIIQFDSEPRIRGQESVSLVAEAAGEYQLTVRPRFKGVPAGSYEIRIEELRAATGNDRTLHESNKLSAESLKLRRAGKYDEALSLIERALEMREGLLGPNHRDVSDALFSMGVISSLKGEYAKAEPLFQRALAIRERTLEPEHPDIATSLNSMANLYSDRGDYARAESPYRRALAIREKALGPEHPETALSLNNLAILHKDKGEYAKAEPLFRRVQVIWEKALGPDNPNVAFCLHNLAFLYWDRGQYVQAEPLYQKSLAIFEKVLGAEHPDIALTLNNLGILYSRIGDLAKAELMHKRALAIREKALGPRHPLVAESLSNLAILRSSKGEYAEAEPLYQRALDVWEKALGPDHRNVGIALDNLASYYMDRGSYAKVEPLLQRALAIWEKTVGPEHPDTAVCVSELADLYYYRGEHAKAESLFRRALAAREKSLGPEHPHVATSLNKLAALYAAKGDIDQSIALQSRAAAIDEHNLALNLAIGSERQKLAYLSTLSGQADRAISFHLRYAPDDLAARNLAATIILQRKGRALDATSESFNALRSRFNAEDQALLDQLTDTRSQLAKLVLGGTQDMPPEEYRDRKKTLEEQAERYEAGISRRSNEFRALSLPITFAAVQAAIPADAALIEFVTYRPFNARATKDEEAYGQPRYVAYVLRHRGEIQWKELGEAMIIDKAITALRDALRDPRRVHVKSLARAVDRQVFQPLRPLLGEITQLLISPDGNLNLVPFAALVDERGRYQVERYSIGYLASGRDLLRLQVDRESRSGPLVVAAPDFGSRILAAVTRQGKRKKAAPNGPAQAQVNVESAGSAFSQYYFSPLPYTAQEGDALRAMLPGATLLTKRQASKTALSQVRSPALLHIATHGFFLKDLKLTPAGERGLQAVDDDPQRLLRELERSGIRIENPLLRSGLALAGANEDKDDGILTALEMTGLNLWGTKLVVLSACDTGVGEVKNGDGVHGLRRALVLAGSESQVMSLWAISDKATRELMVSYYRMLQQGQGRGEALRQVQLEMLKNVNRRHPYYWAGFIQSGEWANLKGERNR